MLRLRQLQGEHVGHRSTKSGSGREPGVSLIQELRLGVRTKTKTHFPLAGIPHARVGFDHPPQHLGVYVLPYHAEEWVTLFSLAKRPALR